MNWIRVLKVIFTEHLGNNRGRQIVYGDNFPQPDLNIQVDIYKYASTLKDFATIQITNMTYGEVINMTKNKQFDVKIVCGYRDSGEYTVFEGAVANISNTFNSDDRSNTMLILCTSKFIARFCQSRMNYSLSSSFNMYSAIKFLCKQAGMSDSDLNISTQLKKQILGQAMSVNNQSLSSIINNITKNNDSLIMEVDGGSGTSFSIFDANKSNSRIVKIKSSQIIGGYPTLNESGLRVSVFPTFNYKAGDTILVNNALINLEEISDLNSLARQSGIYLDRSAKIDENTGDSYGAYMILQVHYSLANRSTNFSCQIVAKARSLISNYVGGAS